MLIAKNRMPRLMTAAAPGAGIADHLAVLGFVLQQLADVGQDRSGNDRVEINQQGIAHVLSQGRGAIVLVPEIALTPQTVQRFAGRFGPQVAVLCTSAHLPSLRPWRHSTDGCHFAHWR